MALLDWTALHPSFGALVDIDLTAPMSGEVETAWRELFKERRLLIVRGRTLSSEDQIRATVSLGRLLKEHGASTFYVSNSRPDGALGDTELAFHSDLSFAPNPYDAISLYGEALEADRSSTIWVDCVGALARAPVALRNSLDGKYVMNVISNINEGRNRFRDSAHDEPRTVHPIIEHRDDGLSYLFANQGQSDHIVGLADAESDLLLDEVFELLYAPENKLEHVWRPFDFVVWDNKLTQHARANIANVGERTLRRVTLGEKTLAEQFPSFMQRVQDTYGKGKRDPDREAQLSPAAIHE